MSNVVADLLPLSAVAILSFIAYLNISVLQVDTRTALADAAPYMLGWFSFLFVSPARRFATVRSFVHTFTLLLAALLLNWQFNLHAEVGLRQLYRDFFPKIDAKLAEIVADGAAHRVDEITRDILRGDFLLVNAILVLLTIAGSLRESSEPMNSVHAFKTGSKVAYELLILLLLVVIYVEVQRSTPSLQAFPNTRQKMAVVQAHYKARIACRAAHVKTHAWACPGL